MHTFPVICIPLYIFCSLFPFLYENSHIPSPNSTYSHPDSPYSHPYFKHSDSDSLHSKPDSPYSHPDSPHSVLRFPILAFTYSQIFDIINILFNLLFFYLILEPFLRENVSIPTDASFCSLKAI